LSIFFHRARYRTLSVLFKTDSREVHMTTAQIEDTATYPSTIVTKQQGGK